MTDKLSRRRFLGRAAASSVGALALAANARRARAATTKDRQAAAKSGDAARAAETTDDLAAAVSKLVPDLMSRLRVPGVSVALVREAKVSWARAFGVRSALDGSPLTAETPFESASLSMPPFACAVLRLAQDGRLSLDRPLWDYLPEFLPADDPNSKKITARMILAHTSGLRSRPADKQIRLASAPGVEWSFTVLGFGYLQKVAEKIAGGSLESLMQKSVLRPCGMAASSYEWNASYERAAAVGHDETGARAPLANYYEKFRTLSEEQKARLRALQPEDAAPSAAYSLTSTPTDYARFLAALVAPRPNDAARARDQLLSDQSLAEMFKPQAKVTEAISWGLEWGLEQTPRGACFWHWGNAKVLQHFAAGSRERGEAAVVMTNGANGLKLCKELFPRLVGVELAAFNLLVR